MFRRARKRCGKVQCQASWSRMFPPPCSDPRSAPSYHKHTQRKKGHDEHEGEHDEHEMFFQ